jgi:hypothetical protein
MKNAPAASLRNHGEWLVNLGIQPVIHLQDVSVQ